MCIWFQNSALSFLRLYLSIFYLFSSDIEQQVGPFSIWLVVFNLAEKCTEEKIVITGDEQIGKANVKQSKCVRGPPVSRLHNFK